MTNAICKTCGSNFERPAGKGRPRLHCDECRRVDTRRRKRDPRPVETVALVCKWCDVSFDGIPSRRYCSDKCRAAFHQRPKGSCAECGKSTHPSKASGLHPRCHECRRSRHGASGYSRGCRCDECRKGQAKAFREYMAKRRAEGRPYKRPTIWAGKIQTCEQCGEEFRNQATRRFCSIACNGLSQRRVRSRELVHVGPVIPKDAPPTPVTVVTLPKWWAVLTAGPCAWCGDHFIGVGTQAAYCSKKCGRESMHAKRGGRFVIEPRVRRAIYERDDFTCQLCREPVDVDADPWSDWYPSLDHIVPQSHMLIPDHSPSNLRTAHRWCNAIRGDGTWHADFFEEAS